MQEILDRIQPRRDVTLKYAGGLVEYIARHDVERKAEIQNSVEAFEKVPTADRFLDLVRTLSGEWHSCTRYFMEVPQKLETHLSLVCDYSVKELLDIRDTVLLSLGTVESNSAGKNSRSVHEEYAMILWKVARAAQVTAETLVTLATDPKASDEKCYSGLAWYKVIAEEIQRVKAEGTFTHMRDIGKSLLDPSAGSRAPLQDVRPSTFLIKK